MDGLVRCPRCWKHTPAGARFCPRCGTSLALWPVLGPGPAAPRQNVTRQPKPPGSNGITALLVFMLISAFGLMATLFVGSTTHAPVIVPPAPPVQNTTPPALQDPDDGAYERERTRRYEHRWETERYRIPPQPVYPPPPYWSQERKDRSHR